MQEFAQGFRWGRGYAPSGLELLQGDYVGGLSLVGVEHLGVRLCVVGVTIYLYLCGTVARVAVPLSVADRHKDYG